MSYSIRPFGAFFLEIVAHANKRGRLFVRRYQPLAVFHFVTPPWPMKTRGPMIQRSREPHHAI